MDLVSQLMGLITSQSNMNEAAISERDALGDKASQLRQSGIAKQEAGTNANAEAQKQLIDLQYSQDEMLQRLQSQLQLDPNDAGNAASRAFAARDQARIAQEAALADQAKLASVDLLSDPVGYIFAQLQLPTVEARVNAATEQIRSADYDYASRTGQVDAGKRTLTAQSAEVLKKQRLAAAEATAKLEAGKLDLLKADAASADAADHMSRLGIRNDVFNNKIKGTEFMLNNQERQLDREIRIASLDESKTRNTLTKLQLEEATKNRQAEADEIALWDSRLALVSKSLGMEVPMTYTTLKRMGDGEMKSKWLTAAAKMSFGDSLVTSIPFFKESAAATPPAMTEFVRQQERSAAETAQQLMSVMPNAKPAERALKALEQNQAEQVSSMSEARTPRPLSDPYWDKKPNAYRAPLVKMAKVVDADPNLAYLKNNVVRQYIVQMDKEGSIPLGSELTAQQTQDIFAAVEEKIAKRQLSPAKAAADIASFFKEASNFNMAMTRYNLFGLPPQRGYIFKLPGSVTAGVGNDTVDLFDPASIENSMARRVAARTKPVRAFGLD